MALVFIILGALLIIVAIRNTHDQLGQLLVGDFTGSASAGSNFLIWVGAILAIAALGFIPALKTPSRLLLALVFLVLFLTRGKGFYSQLQSALQHPLPAAAPTQAAEAPAAQNVPQAIPVVVQGAGGGSSSSGGGPLGEIGQAVGIGKTIAGLF